MTEGQKELLRLRLRDAMEVFNSAASGLSDLEHATAIQIGRLLWAYRQEERSK